MYAGFYRRTWHMPVLSADVAYAGFIGGRGVCRFYRRTGLMPIFIGGRGIYRFLSADVAYTGFYRRDVFLFFIGGTQRTASPTIQIPHN